MNAIKTLTMPILCGALVLALGCTERQGTGMTSESAGEAAPSYAVCVLRPIGGSGVSGTVQLRKQENGVRVVGQVHGLTPGKHGFHVHEFGDLRDQETGKSAGGHFAPEGSPHGARAAAERHVGDLGNIEANDEGVAEFDFVDDHIALGGAHSVLGRALVVHAEEDDYGQPTGNAGARVAFGTISVADPAAEPGD